MRNVAILAAATTVLGLGAVTTPASAEAAPPASTETATPASAETATPASAETAAPASTGAAPGCATPTFANGLAQSVFSSDSSTWIRGEAWVQTSDDSDHDGRPDRIHVDITRPPETANPACRYKAPVIFEDSPYYAGTGPEPFWSVDHELGDPPSSRPPVPPWHPKVTTPIISTAYESTWLPRGFAVVHAESPGTGESTGCPTSGGPNETNAGKAVVDWLNGRAAAFTSPTSADRVSADWTDGDVGMTGTSYNGTLPEAVATTGVKGLKAIVPVSAISDWYDYYRAGGMVRAPFTFQGEDLDILADVVYSRADQQICRPVIDDLARRQDRATGDFSAFWNDRDYMKDVRNVRAAVLVAHGDNDFNVMTKNMAQFYEALKKLGVPHMLYFHQGGHGGAPPDVFMNLWFTRYLFGVRNGVEKLPRAWVVREPDACPVRKSTAAGDQSGTATLAVADSAPLTFGLTPAIPVTAADGTVHTVTRDVVGIPDRRHVTLSAPVATAAGEKVADGATIALQCATRLNPVPYAEWPVPGTAPATLRFTAGAPGVGGLTGGAGTKGSETLTDDATVTAATSANAESSDVRLLYKTPVLGHDVHISGTPSVSVRMAFGKARANLTAVLVDYPPTGPGTILTRGWLDPRTGRRTPGAGRSLRGGSTRSTSPCSRRTRSSWPGTASG